MSDRNHIRIPLGIPHQRVYMRYSPLPRAGEAFDPWNWKRATLKVDQDPGRPGWYKVDLEDLNLPDGRFEYEFVVEGTPKDTLVVSDPFAEEITRFGDYRGVFRIKDRQRVRSEFSWVGEIPAHVRLPGNHEMVIYELPMRWIDAGEDGYARQVGLGTFDKAIFELLDHHFVELGVNAIELLPVQDSPDTLNWGYGTRFFLAPDFDMGEPFDLKLFAKACHQRGIRVILDVVMNHSRKCPLEKLAFHWYYIDPDKEESFANGEKRSTWGGKCFRYRDAVNGSHMAREFHFHMAEYWIQEYHIDGFRIDEFKGINNWDFIREFRFRAMKKHRELFGDSRPFVVIAEDSWRRAGATNGGDFPPNSNPSSQDIAALRPTDAIWDFDFRDELRRIMSNTLHTELGKPGRHERVQAFLGGEKLWNGSDGWRGQGFSDMARRVAYCTSHDVEAEHERRLSAFYLDRCRGQWDDARKSYKIDPATMPAFEEVAREMIVVSFAIMLTCRGIPMFLAGEEFADLHDVEPWNWRRKMSDPVDWYRRYEPGHSRVFQRVSSLIKLRTNPDALELHRNELEFFGMSGIAHGFQQDFDENVGGRVFAYCRTAGRTIGSPGQTAVVANCGWQVYPEFKIQWPWPENMVVREYGGCGQALPTIRQGQAALELQCFQVRVFRISVE